VSGRHEDDRDHDAKRHRAERGLGTSITADSEISTVRPEKRTALPAVSIVTAAASTGERPKPNSSVRAHQAGKLRLTGTSGYVRVPSAEQMLGDHWGALPSGAAAERLRQ
jgi:hypothetical protein